MLDQHDLEQHHRVNAGPAVVLAIQILHKFVDFLEVDGVVDFPQPEGPKIEMISPSFTWMEISFRTGVPSKDFWIFFNSNILFSSLCAFPVVPHLP